VARSPPDDSALRMHVALSPWAAVQRPARNLKQESQRWSRRNWARCKNRRRVARSDEVRWPGAREKRCRLPTRMSARRVPGRTTTGLNLRPTVVRPTLLATVSYRARCAWARCACRCPTYMRHCASFCGLEGGEDSILSIQRNQNAGGVARKLRRHA
jgi:hypothetical protein